MRGRQILIAAIDRIVQFNILEFYRGQHTYVGIDTLGLSSIATGAVLRELGPGFASGHLKPFPIKPSAIYPLEQAKALRRGRRFVARPRDPAAGGTALQICRKVAKKSSHPMRRGSYSLSRPRDGCLCKRYSSGIAYAMAGSAEGKTSAVPTSSSSGC